MYYRKLSSVLCRCRPGQVRTHATIGYVLVLTIIAPSLCESQCELDDTQRSSTKCSGSIQSPRHPDPYPAGQNCSWVIQGNDCKTVQLFINYLDIPSLPGGSCTDYIRIQGSGNYSRQICGSLKDLESSRLNVTQPVIVSFHSKRSLGATGFSIHYQDLLERASKYNLKGLLERSRRDDLKDVWSTNRTYTLPKSPNFTGVVRIGKKNHYIVLQPNVGPAPKCGTSPFTIEDEQRNYEELCEVYGRIYESFINLHINNSVNKNGWSDKLNVYLVPTCRGTIKVPHAQTTVLLTPFFPLSPSMPYECSWVLEKTAFVSIKIIDGDDSEPLPTCSESPIRVLTQNSVDTLCNLKQYVVHEGKIWLIYRTPDTVKTPWRGTLQMQSLAFSQDEKRPKYLEAAFYGALFLGGISHFFGHWIIRIMGFTKNGIRKGSLASKARKFTRSFNIGKLLVSKLQSDGAKERTSMATVAFNTALGFIIGTGVAILNTF